ncbi:serpin B5-like isoform X2 [Protopterus annectens]|nr:serpin B5-like isoform X2 [Protopterus annectens]
MEPLRDANTTFALELFKKMCEKDPKKNVLLCPMALSSSMAVINKGAKENTSAQIGKTLHFDTAGDVNLGYQSLDKDLTKPTITCALKQANRIYGDNSIKILPEYLEASKKYNTQVEQVEFGNEAESDATRQKINDWVKEKTEGKIEELLKKDCFSSKTKLLLVNAGIFKGIWETKFDEANTKECPFQLSKTESKPVQMMQQEGTYRMTTIDDVMTTIIELVINKDLGMLILLPKEIDDESTGLEKLTKELTCEKYNTWTNPSKMINSNVKISIPKFTLDETYRLKEVFTNMGLSEPFNEETADFTGITSSGGLALSEIIHKSVLQVGEEGNETTSTGGGFRSRLLLRKEEVVADHPFCFIIHHRRNRSILAIGKLCCPN